MGQELGLVAGHVDVHGAVVLAALAGHAQVQSVLDVRIAPPACHLGAVEQLEQQVRPAAGRVLFLAGGLVAGAHDRAGVGPAGPDANAAGDRPGEVAAVVGEGEVRGQLPGPVMAPEPEVGIQRAGVDDLVRVHHRAGIPDPLELGERVHQFGAEHDGQQLGAGLAVAMLARQRSAEANAQLRSLGHERPERRDARRGAQVEVDAGVHAALAEVPVQRGMVAVAVA